MSVDVEDLEFYSEEENKQKKKEKIPYLICIN